MAPAYEKSSSPIRQSDQRVAQEKREQRDDPACWTVQAVKDARLNAAGVGGETREKEGDIVPDMGVWRFCQIAWVSLVIGGIAYEIHSSLETSSRTDKEVSSLS